MKWDRAEIAGRLDFLRRTDPGFTRFGCEDHRYLLNEPLTESEVTGFEDLYGVSLPEEYRAFLLQVGDGGAGPFYGIFRLERSSLPAYYPGCPEPREDLLPGFLAGPFPHTRPWKAWDGNMASGRLPGNDDEDYGDPAHIAGSLNLSHQGCGYMVRLVLNGSQRGALWQDGRCSDMGIKPFADGFAPWYLRWLSDPGPAKPGRS